MSKLVRRLGAPVVAPSVFALLILLAGCGGAKEVADPGSPVVAEFGAQRLTLAEFEQQYARQVGSRDSAADDTLGAYQDFLRRYVDFRLKVQQARDLGLDRDSSYQAELAQYRDQLARPYFLEREVLEEVIRDLYQKQQEEINASHVLVRLEETAPAGDTLRAYSLMATLRDSIASGAASFEDIAVRNSQDPSATRNRGELGFFTGGRLIYQFEQMAYTTPVGQLSPIFRTRFGYHILRVNARRPAQPEVRANHILLRIDGQTPADSAAARETVAELKTRLDGGEDFGTLARQYSQDPGSAQNGGDLGFFGTGRMVPPFEQAAFALVPRGLGAISDPVLSPFGYHLIQLTEVKPRPTYEEAYADLKALAERLPRSTELRQEVGMNFRRQAGSTVDTLLVRRTVTAFADSVFRVAYQQGYGVFADTVFASIGAERFTLGDFAGFFRQARHTPPTNPEQYLLQQMDSFLNEEAVDLAAAQLETTDPEFRRIMQEYADGILLFGISEDSVWTVATTDTVGLQRYFAARQGQYNFPERRRVLSYTSRLDTVLQVVKAEIDAGRNVTQILARLEQDSLSVRLDTVFVSEAGGTVFDEALKLALGQRTDIMPNRASRTVLYLDAVEPPRPKTFDEARAEIITGYQEDLEKAWLDRLRAQYRARLYPERLVGAFKTPAAAAN